MDLAVTNLLLFHSENVTLSEIVKSIGKAHIALGVRREPVRLIGGMLKIAVPVDLVHRFGIRFCLRF